MEKLVRDRIPQLMSDAGVKGHFRVARQSERLGLLLSKLMEEAFELKQDPGLLELADVVEVVRAIQHELGISDAEMETERGRKEASKGGFGQGIVLQFDDR